jgi:hypothetical protein
MSSGNLGPERAARKAAAATHERWSRAVKIWSLSPAYADRQGNLLPNRWDVDPRGRVSRQISQALPRGPQGDAVPGPVQRWDPMTRLAAGSRPRPVDITVGPSERPAVSTRFKDLLTKKVPGQFQFLPVLMTYRNRVLDVPTYWILNCVNFVDCLNLTASGYRAWGDDPYEGILDNGPFVDPTRVPGGIHAFYPRYATGYLLVTDYLRRAILRAGIKGMEFWLIPTRREARRRSMEWSVKVWTDSDGRPLGTPTFAPATAQERATPPPPIPTTIEGLMKACTEAELVRAAEPADERRLAAAERQLGVHRPAAYRDFMLRFGAAGLPDAELLPVTGNGASNIVAFTRKFRDWRELEWPDQLVAISDDGSGGCLCLDLRKGD